MKKKANSMNINKAVKFFAIALIAIISFTSCEDDFSEVGSNIVSNNNFNARLFEKVELDAYSRKINRIQTNRLPGHNLGVFNDPVYGKTTANILTQLSLEQTNPDFGDDAQLDSVILTIPYFATALSQSQEGIEYELDSIFGNDPINFSIYESNYSLRSTDPSNNYETQFYYSDQMDQFESFIETTPLVEVNNFRPSAKEVITYELNDDEIDTIRSSPRLRIALPTEFFQEKIINRSGTALLLSQENFRNYFRGLYFKTDENIQQGLGILLNLNSPSSENQSLENRANIALYYKTTIQDINGEENELRSTYRLSFSPNIVNVYNNEYEELPSEENLYVKGGEGSLAVIDLFTNQQQLDSIRDLNWLVNEANLTFYVEENIVPEGNHEPERLFIYDVKNGRVLDDFVNDISATENGTTSRLNHLGKLSTDKNGNRYYKLRITDYINNIINKDSTNTRLAVVASQNVNIASQINVEVEDEENIEVAPSSAAISQEGTVLYDTNTPNNTKRLKLNIFYTEPE
ncbi:DUF4270 domain-containing protein [Mesonia maritima]|uniref:DUF4270 domain-containing protein n=1 Tax=Mesonia maritima TaxID=1793873 RepID=A0ABU1K1W6_9FLAO|nr:DUF4270 domain-containing protein [Mesonia maritima]MDR6299583.1 hypothetical protein [Mesonia maritima]